MRARGRPMAGSIAVTLVAALWIAGCQGDPFRSGDKGRRDVEGRLSPRQRQFVAQLRRAASDSAARRQLLAQERSPHVGPLPTQLRTAALVETIRRGQAMFMGSQTIEVETEITRAIRRAFASAGIRAPVVRARGSAPPAGHRSTRLRVRRIDYYCDGQCAVVHTAVERGPSWTYEQKALFVLRSDRWQAAEILEP